MNRACEPRRRLWQVALCLFVGLHMAGCEGKGNDATPARIAFAVDINGDGKVDAADETARASGRAKLMRWYEPVWTPKTQALEPHYAKCDYAQLIRIDTAAAGTGFLTLTTDPSQRVRMFSDADCTQESGGEWERQRGRSEPIGVWLLAVPEDSRPQPCINATLTATWREKRNGPAVSTAGLKLRISGTRLPNPEYFQAARDALVEGRSGNSKRSGVVFTDLLFRDSQEPFHVVVLRPGDVRLQVFDATGMATDPVNAKRPNPGVRAANIREAVQCFPKALAVINGNYFHPSPAAPGTRIGMYPECALLEDGLEWRSDPVKWGSGWRETLGALAQRKDGTIWYADDAPGWPAGARSGISGLKICNWDAGPHALIGIARVPATGNGREAEEVLVLLCSDVHRAPRTNARESQVYNLRAVKESLGLVFMGALDGGGSNALACMTPGGELRVIPGSTTAVAGRHMPGSVQCINSYLVFHRRDGVKADAPVTGAAAEKTTGK